MFYEGHNWKKLKSSCRVLTSYLQWNSVFYTDLNVTQSGGQPEPETIAYQDPKPDLIGFRTRQKPGLRSKNTLENDIAYKNSNQTF
ncbi:hypothetical protein L596_023041 [Steinernema carpocapsae]|uniref:Uncharacterized protein n=1 Tax=Steinernema carpocapsae TaxID=34508 RepID=A0A4U5MD99_STECR|nr:hypothetical protein L596_023041 [Steinernema carpocapsae]